MELDDDGQPISRGVNWRGNVNKQLQNLKGILNGIAADQLLDEKELGFLDLWLKDCILPSEGDVFDLRDQLETVLSDGILDEEEREDTLRLIDSMLEFGRFGFDGDSGNKLNELIGLLTGISSNDHISDTEVRFLRDWLALNDSNSGIWQFDQLSQCVENVLADGIITEQERLSLKKAFDSMSGIEFAETGSASAKTATAFLDEVKALSLDTLRVVLTGKFVANSRKVVSEKLVAKGCILQKGIRKDTDLLLVGGYPSRDWKFATSGTKIEDAIARRKQGHKILILSEEKLNSLSVMD